MRSTKTIVYLLLSLIMFVGTGSAQHGGPSGEPIEVAVAGGRTAVPMSLYANKPVIEAKINGKGPFKFFLDTGAGITVLSQEFANEISLKSTGTVKVGDPANPQAVDAQQNTLETVEIGGAVLKNCIALSFDRSGLYQPGAPRGVLGMPLFRKLLLTIDYPQNRVVIEKGTLPAADGKRIIPFNIIEGGVFGVSLRVGTTDMTATIDSGAGSGISFPEPMMDKLALAGKPTEVGRGRTVGGESIVYGAKFSGQIALGEYALDQPEVRFFGRLKNVNLGYQFLRPFAVTIDQQNMVMRFQNGSVSAAPAIKAADATATGKFAQYAGSYGERVITVDKDGLYLQRVSGPMGEGPKIKLVEVNPGEFALEGHTDVRVKFQRSAKGVVEAVDVLTPAGTWENSKKQQVRRHR